MGLLTIVRVHVNCQIAILLMSMLPGGIMFGFFRWTEDGGFRDLLKFFMFVMFMATTWTRPRR